MKTLKRGDPRSAATAHLFLKCCPRSSHSHFLRVPSTASRWQRITTPLVRQNPYRVNLFGEYIYIIPAQDPKQMFFLYHWSQHETLNTWSQHETLNNYPSARPQTDVIFISLVPARDPKYMIPARDPKQKVVLIWSDDNQQSLHRIS